MLDLGASINVMPPWYCKQGQCSFCGSERTWDL